MTQKLPGTSEPDRGTRRAKAFWRATRPAMAVPTLFFGALAALAGPVICYVLIARGLREGRTSWVVLGALCGLPWLLVVVSALRKAVKRGGDGAAGGGDVGR